MKKTNSKSIGEISEGMVLARFLQNNWTVLIPFGDNKRYDFVIDRGFGFEKIQVKTGRIRKGSLRFATCSSQVHRGTGRQGYKGQCDYFAVYCPDNEKIYMTKVDETTNGYGCYRIEEAKNKQIKNVKLAKNFEL